MAGLQKEEIPGGENIPPGGAPDVCSENPEESDAAAGLYNGGWPPPAALVDLNMTSFCKNKQRN